MASHQGPRMGLANFVRKNDDTFIKPAVPLTAEQRKELANEARMPKPLALKSQRSEVTNDVPKRHVNLARKQQSTLIEPDRRVASPTPRGLFDSEYASSDTTANSVHHLSLHDESNNFAPSSVSNEYHHSRLLEQRDAFLTKEEADDEPSNNAAYKMSPNHVLDTVVSSLGMSGMPQRRFNVPMDKSAGSYPSTTDGVLSQADDEFMGQYHDYSDGVEHAFEKDPFAKNLALREYDRLPYSDPVSNPDDEYNIASQKRARHSVEVENQHWSEEEDEDNARLQYAVQQRLELNHDFLAQQMRMKKQEMHLHTPHSIDKSSYKHNNNNNYDHDRSAAARFSPPREEYDPDNHSDPTTPTRQRRGVISRKPAPTSPGPPQLHNATDATATATTPHHNADHPSKSLASSSTPPPPPSPPQSLDYDLPTLHALPYTALQSESFDTIPPAPSLPTQTTQTTITTTSPTLFHLPPDQTTAPLPTRLALILTHSPSSQQHFLASLTSSEWEEAGSWFSERFAQILEASKKSRRERREIAVRFEEEVSGRLDAVEREDEALEGALVGMKRCGGKVLESGTPKRRG